MPASEYWFVSIGFAVALLLTKVQVFCLCVPTLLKFQALATTRTFHLGRYISLTLPVATFVRFQYVMVKQNQMTELTNGNAITNGKQITNGSSSPKSYHEKMKSINAANRAQRRQGTAMVLSKPGKMDVRDLKKLMMAKTEKSAAEPVKM